MAHWLDNAVFYEIYPQSFNDTNADGIGDIPGITQKLDYISALGCNALWLNPCFDSPFNDAGYDVRDYRLVAPRYGTNEDLRELFVEAHKRGMHVLLDLVIGHTSMDHEWFQKSMANDPEYAARYIWSPDVNEKFTDVGSVSGHMNGFCDRGSCAVNYYTTQPALNFGFARVEKPWQSAVDSPEAQATVEAFKDIMRFWLQMGCDGFRVDMAGSLVKNDEGQRETIKLWQGFRRFMDEEFPDAVLVAEWGDPARALEAGFHMDFLLHFGETRYMELFRETPYFCKQGGGDISAFTENYIKMRSTNEEGMICIPSSNHDMPRIAHQLDEDDLKVAFAFLLTMPGAPFLYYGDELAMRYLDLPSKEGGFTRTGSRTPMQWDDTLNAGFSSAKPELLYLPLDPDPARPTAERAMADQGSLWHEIRRLIELRQNTPALQNNAPLTFLHYAPGACPFVYRRGEGSESVTVLHNPSNAPVEYTLDGAGQMRVLYSVGSAPTVTGSTIQLPPCSTAILA